MSRPVLVHLTATDMSLDWLLGPQLVAFREAGFDVIGVSGAGDHVGALEVMGVKHIPLEHATRSFTPLEDLRAFRELRRLFRSMGPDIVHTHNPKPGVYGRVAAKAAGVPSIVNTCHGLYALPTDPRHKRAAVYALERMAASCSDAELVQSAEDAETLLRIGVPPAKIKRLGNGIDLHRFDPASVSPGRVAEIRRGLGIGSDEVVCGLVGRLVREKGYQEVFEVAAELSRTHPAVRFVVVGPREDTKTDAVPESDLARMRELGVCFLGRRDDIVELYSAMDLYVLASHREGFPRSAMEAAAMGLPVVATDIRGCREVVAHGETGLLVPPRDPASLTRAVVLLVEDAERRLSMGMRARARALESFDIDRVIELTLAVYRRLLDSRARGDA